MPDNPRITIEISGPRHAGKSVVAALLKRLLLHHDIASTGPEKLPHRSRGNLAAALAQIDARAGMRPLLPARAAPADGERRAA